MIISGLPLFQRKALKGVLEKRVDDQNCEIHFTDQISLRRLSSLWYGGNVAEVKYKGYIFHIDAIGDVYADLYHVHDDRHLCYVKDKNNNGNFGSEMLSYFRSDKTLYEALGEAPHKYHLKMQDNNWWECFVTDPQEDFHDLMWALDDDNLFDAIGNVLKSMDEMIDYIEAG